MIICVGREQLLKHFVVEAWRAFVDANPWPQVPCQCHEDGAKNGILSKPLLSFSHAAPVLANTACHEHGEIIIRVRADQVLDIDLRAAG